MCVHEMPLLRCRRVALLSSRASILRALHYCQCARSVFRGLQTSLICTLSTLTLVLETNSFFLERAEALSVFSFKKPKWLRWLVCLPPQLEAQSSIPGARPRAEASVRCAVQEIARRPGHPLRIQMKLLPCPSAGTEPNCTIRTKFCR